MSAVLGAVDAAELTAILDRECERVCMLDPRTLDTRRSDAFAARLRGGHLTCNCGFPDCQPPSDTEDTEDTDKGQDEPDYRSDRSATPAPRAPLPRTPPGRSSSPSVAKILRRPHHERPMQRPRPSDGHRERTLTALHVFVHLRRPTEPSRDGRPPEPGNPIETDPARTNAEYPDGHGGHTTPPPGALRYTPSAALAQWVRAQYPTCRFPGCAVQSSRCDLDHIVGFDHKNPEQGAGPSAAIWPPSAGLTTT